MPTTYNPLPLAAVTFSSNSSTDGSVPAVFDAFLYRALGGFQQLKLTIKLRINLKQLNDPIVFDFDKNLSLALPWNNADWTAFIGAAAAQANMWNDKFWLVPPPSFSGFDVVYEKDSLLNSFPNKAFRPNIRCALEVDFSPTGDAHRTIEVANLNRNFVVAAGRHLDPTAFRSHALLYDSLDAVPWVFPLGAGPGLPARFFCIAHEIGHAIGLDHVGVLMKTPLCQAWSNLPPVIDMALPSGSPFKGGTNSMVCYGFLQELAVSDNIMGYGDKFTAVNAKPWRWALSMLITKMLGARSLHEMIQWRVVVRDPGPGSWIDNGFGVGTPDPESVRVTANDDSLVMISGDVLFDIDKSEIKPAAITALEKAAAAIKAKTSPRLKYIFIDGHTDETGAPAHNRHLSELRARAVADWFFTQKYLSESNTRTQGFGETRPIAPNTDALGRAKNRRVEIRLMNS